MRISPPEQLTDTIYLLGNRDSIIYLVHHNGESALFGGGTVHIAGLIKEQISKIAVHETSIKTQYILHSHFDHMGTVSFLKSIWPWMTISASYPAKEFLVKPKVIATIDNLNKSFLNEKNMLEEGMALGLTPFNGLHVDTPLKEGDVFQVGERSFQIIEVPGHSTCSIAIYSPEEKALFTSDSGGLPIPDGIFTAAGSNFDLYMSSLEKMNALDIELFLPEHFFAVTGNEAKTFISKSIESAKKTRSLLENILDETKDFKTSINVTTQAFLKEMPADFFPKYVVEIIAGQMLKYLSKDKKM